MAAARPAMVVAIRAPRVVADTLPAAVDIPPVAVVDIPPVAVDIPAVDIANGQRRCRQRLYGSSELR